jgi:hypothetical protein
MDDGAKMTEEEAVEGSGEIVGTKYHDAVLKSHIVDVDPHEMDRLRFR